MEIQPLQNNENFMIILTKEEMKDLKNVSDYYVEEDYYGEREATLFASSLSAAVYANLNPPKKRKKRSDVGRKKRVRN